MWSSHCRVTPLVSGRWEEGEASISRNNFLRSFILRLKVHLCISSQNNSTSRCFAWDTISRVYACEQPKHTGLTGKEMKMWVALTSSDAPRAKELHKDHQICTKFFPVQYFLKFCFVLFKGGYFAPLKFLGILPAQHCLETRHCWDLKDPKLISLLKEPFTLEPSCTLPGYLLTEYRSLFIQETWDSMALFQRLNKKRL